MRIAGTCAIVAPALLLITSAIAPANKDDAAEQLAVVARHQARWFVSDSLVMIALVLLVPAVLGMMRALRGRWSAYGTWGGAFALAGIVAVSVQSAFGFVEWQMVKGPPARADLGEMARLLARVEDADAVQPIVYAAGLLSLGLAVLAVGFARAGLVRVWAAAALIAGAIGVDVGYSITSGPLTIAGGVLTFVGMAPAGLALRSSAATSREIPAAD